MSRRCIIDICCSLERRVILTMYGSALQEQTDGRWATSVKLQMEHEIVSAAYRIEL